MRRFFEDIVILLGRKTETKRLLASLNFEGKEDAYWRMYSALRAIKRDGPDSREYLWFMERKI
jgi:hypothetical protein